ncbi:MAG TPA: tetratricopeptide repeat protein [Myxococcota bacterium]|jgi:tetratricopeptide (TPR) repeat protein|nr:tetratricopeptide repeat protein [Myxococcota bacterium]
MANANDDPPRPPRPADPVPAGGDANESTEVGPPPHELMSGHEGADSPLDGSPGPLPGPTGLTGETRVPAATPGDTNDPIFSPPPRFQIRGVQAEFMGRAAELQTMQDFARRVFGTREAGMMTLAGETGMGKSRLLDHFVSTLPSLVADVHSYSGQCAGRESDPYAPFSAIIAARCGLAEADDRLVSLNKILEVATGLLEGERGIEVAHLLSHLIGVPFPRSPVIERFMNNPERLTMRTHAAVRRLFEADATKGPVLLCFEDLNQASQESVDLLYYLANNLRHSPILLVCTVDQKFVADNPDWGQGDFPHVKIELQPLPDGDVAAMLREYLHRAADIPEELVMAACERSRGNPLQLAEIVRTLIEQGVVDTGQEPWVIDQAKLAASDIPSDVEGIVEARLALLTADERDILNRAAVVGETFWRDAVLALVRRDATARGEMPEEFAPGHDPFSRRTDENLGSLVRKELIIKKPQSIFPGTAEFRFAHRVTRELVYARVRADQLRRYHRQIAQWLELAVGEERMRHLELLAEHHERGGDRSRAAYAYVYAADQARARYANEKAILLYERGLACFEEEDIALMLEVLHNLGSVYHLVGDYDSALMHFDQMLRYAWQLVSRSKGGVAYNKMGRAYREKGDYRKAVEALQRGLGLFRDSGDLRGVASSLDDIGQVHLNQGNYDAAHRYATDALRHRRRLGDRRSVGTSLLLLGNVNLHIGRLDEAELCFREARELFAQTNDREGQARALNSLGMLSHTREQLDRALARYEEALRISQEIGNRRHEAAVLNNLGEAHAQRKELGLAEQYLKEAEEICRELGDKRLTTEVLRNVGNVYRKMGELAKAQDYVTRALEVARSLGSKEYIARALQALAEVHTHAIYDASMTRAGARTVAEEHFQHAIDLYEEMGNDAELARAQAAYGRYLAEMGRIAEGRRSLQEAMRLYAKLNLQSGLAGVKATILSIRGLGDDTGDSGGTAVAPPLVAADGKAKDADATRQDVPVPRPGAASDATAAPAGGAAAGASPAASPAAVPADPAAGATARIPAPEAEDR